MKRVSLYISMPTNRRIDRQAYSRKDGQTDGQTDVREVIPMSPAYTAETKLCSW